MKMLEGHAEQIKAESAKLLMDQNERLDPLIRRPPAKTRRQKQPLRHLKSKSSSSSSSAPQSRNATAQTEGVAIQVAQYTSACQPTCVCCCHMQFKTPAPAFINRVLGQLFVGAAGVPLLSQKCDSQVCKSSKVPRVECHASMGPQFSLKALRRVPDSAQCVHYAMNGNIEGLKDLFNRGLASPWDVSSTRGYTLSRWALYSKQYKTAKFLTFAGSDADYRPIAKSDNSTRNKAFDNLLQGGLDKEAEEDIRYLTASSDWIEDQNFSRLHKVIVQLLPLPLEQILEESPEEVDMDDALGRTPLLWAAARGDHKAIQLLLDYNANPNIMDMYLAPPVSYAADRGHTLCVKLLLEAGAAAEPKLPPGVKLGSPLNCAARNTRDPVLLKYLLTYGAEVDNTGVDGNTALIHASRTNNARFAVLLLDYNANINAASITQHTPLTTAITYNSHEVLQLLLERWDEFSTCPRLRGPHLLEITALYADLATVKLLAAADHFKLNYDPHYSLRDFAKRLTERSDVTKELIDAFDELLSVLNEEPKRTESRESLMEKGLKDHLSPLKSMYELEKLAAEMRQSKGGYSSPYSDFSDEEVEFQDAVEHLEALNLEAEDFQELTASCPAQSEAIGLV